MSNDVVGPAVLPPAERRPIDVYTLFLEAFGRAAGGGEEMRRNILASQAPLYSDARGVARVWLWQIFGKTYPYATLAEMAGIGPDTSLIRKSVGRFPEMLCGTKPRAKRILALTENAIPLIVAQGFPCPRAIRDGVQQARHPS